MALAWPINLVSHLCHVRHRTKAFGLSSYSNMVVFALAAAPVVLIVPILAKFATLVAHAILAKFATHVAHAILPILAKFSIFAARATVAVLAIVAKFTIVAVHATTHAVVVALTFLVAHPILPILAKFAIFAARAIVAVLAIVAKVTIVAVHVTTHAIVIALTFLAAHLIQIPAVFAALPAILAAFLILAAVLVLALVVLIAVIGVRFFGTSDISSRSYPHPSPRHHEPTRLLRRPPVRTSFTRNSYALNQSQTAGQTPAILYGPNRGRESCQATSTSAHSRASYQRPPSPDSAHNFTPVCILISIYRGCRRCRAQHLSPLGSQG